MDENYTDFKCYGAVIQYYRCFVSEGEKEDGKEEASEEESKKRKREGRRGGKEAVREGQV